MHNVTGISFQAQLPVSQNTTQGALKHFYSQHRLISVGPFCKGIIHDGYVTTRHTRESGYPVPWQPLENT
jgi:hypothetical protein